MLFWDGRPESQTGYYQLRRMRIKKEQSNEQRVVSSITSEFIKLILIPVFFRFLPSLLIDNMVKYY